MDCIPYHDGDRPVATGSYVAYTNGPVNVRAEPVLLFFDAQERQWYHRGSDIKYRDKVYCCVGPLPIVPLTD